MQRRIVELERRLLPAANPTHLYTEDEYELVRAYLLLSHAEIEACLEDLAWDLVERCFRAYRTAGRVRVPLLALLAYYQGESAPALQSLTKPPKVPPPDLSQRVTMAHSEYRGRVRRNNGIKESNLLPLLLPVGVRESDFPMGWLQDVNTLGSERGDWAHKSLVSVRQPPDPYISQELVQRVIAGMGIIDGVLIKLRP